MLPQNTPVMTDIDFFKQVDKHLNSQYGIEFTYIVNTNTMIKDMLKTIPLTTPDYYAFSVATTLGLWKIGSFEGQNEQEIRKNAFQFNKYVGAIAEFVEEEKLKGNDWELNGLGGATLNRNGEIVSLMPVVDSLTGEVKFGAVEGPLQPLCSDDYFLRNELKDALETARVNNQSKSLIESGPAVVAVPEISTFTMR